VVLHIMVNGRQYFVAPYRPENMRETARALDEQLPILRQQGRVAVFVNNGNVSHIIVAS
jgi:cell division protein ZapA (FtsZ GTPase activity inhibitor)